MKLLIISLCTTGVMKDHFISYCRCFSKSNEVYCITNDNVTCEELNAKETLNLYYKRQKKLSYFSLSKVNKIKKFVKSVNPDIVYIFTPHPVNILIAGFLKRYKLIFQVHDPVPHSNTSFLDKLVLKVQLKQYYKYSDKLIVAGNFLKNQITEKYPKLENKISVVPFAVIDSLQREIPAQPCTIDLLFFGRIEYYKGLDILFDSLKLLENKINCYIIGKGDIYKAYGQSIEIPEGVTFINDYISDEELAIKIAQSKIIVLPYRDATGSMTVAQAFYYGKPVIATDVGVFPEYVKDGGVIVEKDNPEALAETIKILLNDNNLLKSLSEKAAKIYEEDYTLEKMSDNMQKVFNETVNEKR